MTASFFRRELRKPDGRGLWLYARHPIDESIAAVAPPGLAAAPNPHLRYHPLRGEWVLYAGHRQGRTFLPPAGYNPLAPTADPDHPTEVPAGEFDVAVFENLFPSLAQGAHDPPAESVPTAPGRGACEVVVFAREPTTSLGQLPASHAELIVRVWADRTRELGARDDVVHVMPFENRGVEVGVTLQHPHGQIYAYPFVPPLVERQQQTQAAHLAHHGRGLLATMLADERAHGQRVVVDAGEALAIVPVCARYAYEVWVAPVRHVPSLVDLDDAEITALTRALQVSLRKLDGLFGRPMPYVLVVHQAPTDGRPHPEWHLHIEIYPALRMRDRLKYLAGSELGAGVFTADTFPEEKAAELRRVVIS